MSAGQAPRRRPDETRAVAAGSTTDALTQWVAGQPLDWLEPVTSRGTTGPCGVGLPTYPFAEESYWAGRVTAPTTETLGRAAGRHTRRAPDAHQVPDGTLTAYRTVFDGSSPS
ncbi:hypothetical protein LV779_34490 [Streptomyces thinghirensis]|nr:hypothetical protein [Streptomyces thinghirensis]